MLAWCFSVPFLFTLSEHIFYNLILWGTRDIGRYLNFHEALACNDQTPHAVAVVTERETGIAEPSESSAARLLAHGDTEEATLPPYSVSPALIASLWYCYAYDNLE